MNLIKHPLDNGTFASAISTDKDDISLQNECYKFYLWKLTRQLWYKLFKKDWKNYHLFFISVFTTNSTYLWAMKIVSFIFSLYLLTLSFMPCTDGEDCKDETQSQTSTFATTDHSNHDNDTENCSPFCVCACCGQNITTLFYPVDFLSFKPVSKQVFSVYTSAFVSEVYFNIWQPPKIS